VKAASQSPAAVLPAHPLSALAQWVVFGLDAGRYAIPLSVVQRVVRAAQVTPLPLAPSVVIGAIDIEGRVLPVFNVRRRFRLPERDIDPGDHFLIANTARGTVALVIDMAHGVLECPDATTVDAAMIATDIGPISGVLVLRDGLVLIHDLDRFLSPDEARALEDAMNREPSHADQEPV